MAGNKKPVVVPVTANGVEDTPPIQVVLTGTDIDGTVDFFGIKKLPKNGSLFLDAAMTIPIDTTTPYPASAGSLTVYFRPNDDFSGRTTFQYTAVDDQGAVSSAGNVTVNVAPQNDAPTPINAVANGNEDSAVQLKLTATDPDGKVASFKIVDLPANGSLFYDKKGTNAVAAGDEISAKTKLYFIPNADWNGTTAFHFRAIDDQGALSSATATETINIAAVNDAPETDSVAQTGGMDSLIPIILTGNDVDGTVTEFRIAKLPKNGTLYLDAAMTTPVKAGMAYAATGETLTLYFQPNSGFLGTTSFSFEAIDDLGLRDKSSATATITVIADGTPPDAPAINSFADDTGTPNDGLTADQTVTLSGTAEANSTIEVFDGANSLGTATANGSGNWSFTTPALGDGTHSFTATATDAANNTGAPSSPFVVEIDATAPGAPVIVQFSDDTGTSNDAITYDDTLTLTGTALPNSVVEIFDGASSLGTTTADGNGDWNFSTLALADGAHSFTATATDAAGNTSPASTTFGVTIQDPVFSLVPTAINENNAANAVVGTIAVDTGGTFTYSLTDNAGGLFAIQNGNEIIVTAPLDAETLQSVQITVEANDGAGGVFQKVLTVSINDLDEFDVGAVTDTNAAANAVDENAANGTAVGVTASATDGDVTNNTITYSLIGNANGAFTIDATTGVVTVLNGTLIDRESDSTLDITVRANSSDGSHSDQTFTINVNDVDEFDVGAVTDSNAAANAVNEGAAIGTVVGITASASDADATNSGITYSLTNDAGSAFQIDPTTGVVTVRTSSAIDRETSSSLDITVRATSADGSHSDETFTIAVNDVDEFDVGAVTDANVAANAVDENTTVGTLVGITASASDADATSNAITYSLTNDAGGRFQINSTTGVVTVLDGSLINRETAASHNITVRATSADTSFTEETFTINVNDVNEFSPSITSDGGGDTAIVNVQENGAAVTTVAASDSDATANLVYSISGGIDAALFTIDQTSGALSFLTAPDFETPQDADLDNAYEVIVSVSDGTNSDSQAITVQVTNDVDAPIFLSGNGATASYTLDEDVSGVKKAVKKAVKSAVIEVKNGEATDDDASAVVLSIDGGPDAALFQIVRGELRFITPPNFENPQDADFDNIYHVTIRATENGVSTTQDVTVTIVDVNEAPSQIQIDGTFTASVQELAPVGTVVGTLTAIDPDAADQDQGVFTYSLIDDAGGRFAIVGNQLVVNGDIDFERNPDGLYVGVEVVDSAGNARGQYFFINVIDTPELSAPDGYVAGATVFADADGDFALDPGEKSVVSDNLGNFNFASGGNPTILFGGTDIGTGLSFKGLMATTAGATIISPLTTIVVAHMDEFASSEATANAAVLQGLGLAGGIGLLSGYDQIAAVLNSDANGAAAARAATRLQSSMIIAIAILVAAGASEQAAAAEFARQIADWISDESPNPINLTDDTRIEQLIDDAATALAVTPDAAVVAGTADIIAAVNAAIAAFASSGATLLQDLAKAGIVAHAAQADLAGANAGNIGGFVTEYSGTNLNNAISAATAGNVQGINGDNTLTGTAGADYLDGGAGNDHLSGGDGDDVLVGGDGNDTLLGGNGRDLLIGGPGNDTIDGGQWFTNFDNSGSGDLDRVSYRFATSAVTVDLSILTAQDTLGGGIDTITHVEGVIGSDYNDTLLGGGNDFIETFRGGGGDDLINGRDGNDRAEYVDATAGVAISLAAGSVDGVAGGVGTDTLMSVEDITGSEHDDTFDATGFDSNSTNSGSFGRYNNFRPGDGDDTIIGNGDTRIDYFNAPHAVVVDLTNRDVNTTTGKVYGGDGVGTDTFSGVNRVRGSLFDDELIGGQQEYSAPGQAEFFDGVGGNDFIFGGSGFDYALYSIAPFFLTGVQVADNPHTTDIDESTLTFGISVNLASGIVVGDPLSFGTDTLREVEGIIGTVLADLYDATGFGADSENRVSLGVLLDEFEGGAGDDIIIGSGNTRVSYRNATSGVIVTLEDDGNGSGKGTVTGGDISVGNDVLVGGISSVRGSDFADVITGYDNASGTLQIFDGQGGDDTIDGNDGFDRVTYNQDIDVTTGITITVTANGSVAHANTGRGLTALVTGNPSEVGNDQLFDIESFTGTDFNDVLTVTGLNTPTGFGLIEFEGGGGNDTITGLFAAVTGDPNSFTFTRLSFITATGGVTVTFSGAPGAGTAVGDPSAPTTIGDASVGTDTFTNIRDIRGGNYDDVIVGRYAVTPTGLDNGIFQGGAGGNDTLEGGSGNDALWGGTINGNERFDGITGTGFDDFDYARYIGANGAVTITLGAGTAAGSAAGSTVGGATNIGTDALRNIEGVIGSNFNDTLNGADNFLEAFRGGGGNDAINGGGGLDIASYVDATAGVTIDLAAGTVDGIAGGVGSDTLTSVESIVGSAQGDTFDATGFSDASANAGSLGSFNSFRGGAGNDQITGNDFTRIDYSDGTAGITVDLTAASVNAIAAGLGTDTLNGGVNSVRGTNFADTLIGGAFDGDGEVETFIGGGGDDSITGGLGFDRAMYNSDGNVSATIEIDVPSATETGKLDTHTVALSIDLANGIVIGDPSLAGTDTLSGVEAITGSILGDLYDARSFGSDSTNAGSLGTLNEFEGHAGDDFIYGNGNTRIAFYNAQEGVVVDLDDPTVTGGPTGSVTGGASVGNDLIYGGVNRVRGSDFADTISGDAEANILEGEAGADRIEGRGGNDRLAGGAGDDTFVFATADYGRDVVADFQAGAATDDVIEFSIANTGFTDFASVFAAATQIGADVVISGTAGQSVTLLNVDKVNLHQDDFTFV